MIKIVFVLVLVGPYGHLSTDHILRDRFSLSLTEDVCNQMRDAANAKLPASLGRFEYACLPSPYEP